MLKKIIILFVVCFLVCGCNVEYNLIINKAGINDEMIIKYDLDDTVNKENDDELMGNRLNALIDYDVYPLFEDYSVKYNKKEENNEELNKLILTYDYNFSEFKKANVINNCFKNKSITCNKESCNINLNGYFYCLYNNDEILINVKTNYNVVDENSDSKKGNIYTWKIDKNNYQKVDIKLVLDSSKTNLVDSVIDNINTYEDEDVSNSVEKIYIFIGFLILLIFLFVLIKFKNSNKK